MYFTSVWLLLFIYIFSQYVTVDIMLKPHNNSVFVLVEAQKLRPWVMLIENINITE